MVYLFSIIFSLPFEFFARAGGGGSSSGGSSGGGIEILFGYIPMHFVGALLARIGKKNEALKILVSVVGWMIGVIYAAAWVLLLHWYIYGILIAIAALIGTGAGLYGWFGQLTQSRQVKNLLQTAATNDSTWDETMLLEHAQKTFLQYQKDWSNLDTESIKGYLTPGYHYHASLLMYILQLMGRKDLMRDIVIEKAVIIDAADSTDNSQDRFTVGFTAKAHDQLIENDGTVLYTDDGTFTEYWTFTRSGNAWLLDHITQSTENPYAADGMIQSLAAKHGYGYSSDMGWLFIPKRGQLFNESRFGVSDINNHIVGMYHDLLVQIYTYSKTPSAGTYIIAQANVPKHYGDIVVRRKGAFQRGIRGLERVETEWTEFNKKYDVFATKPEQATSFELLNPTYMEQLEALPFNVNIEVVDNVVYLYTDHSNVSVYTAYETMLDVLYKAFKEMRL